MRSRDLYHGYGFVIRIREATKRERSSYPDHHHVGLQQDLGETGLQHVQADVGH